MQNLDVSKTIDAWSSLADTVFVPHTEAEYERLVSLLDRLVDVVGEDESMAGFVSTFRELSKRGNVLWKRRWRFEPPCRSEAMERLEPFDGVYPERESKELRAGSAQRWNV